MILSGEEDNGEIGGGPESASDEADSFCLSQNMEHAAREASVLLPVYSILSQLLAKNNLNKIADLEFRAVSSLAEMEISGIYIDSLHAREIAEQEENEICDILFAIQDEARRKGFVTVTHDGRRLCYYINPEKQEQVMAFLRR